MFKQKIRRFHCKHRSLYYFWVILAGWGAANILYDIFNNSLVPFDYYVYLPSFFAGTIYGTLIHLSVPFSEIGRGGNEMK